MLVEKAKALPHKILLPAFKSRGGHPVYLPGWILSEIIARPATSTLREVLYCFEDEIVKVEVDDSGILEDIDTVEDLARLEKLKC